MTGKELQLLTDIRDFTSQFYVNWRRELFQLENWKQNAKLDIAIVISFYLLSLALISTEANSRGFSRLDDALLEQVR